MPVVIVCGGRHYADRAFVYRALDYIHATRKIDYLIEGGQTGADTFAREWAKERGVPHQREDAYWDLHGGAAGPIRNRKMLVWWEPHGVIAFNGDKGTRNMKQQATERGVPIYEPDQHRDTIERWHRERAAT